MNPTRWPALSRGLVAILRGVRPHEAAGIAVAIHDAGIAAIEVPLNSPEPFASIASIRRALPPSAVVGAGTVLLPAEVDRLAEAGGGLVVSPNMDAEVIARTARLGLVSMPGVFTATEAFAALRHGASALKVFPASVMGPGGVAALRAVLPAGTVVGAVGGIDAEAFAAYAAAGVTVFGLGTSLYRPGMDAGEAAVRARAAVAAWDALEGETSR